MMKIRKNLPIIIVLVMTAAFMLTGCEDTNGVTAVKETTAVFNTDETDASVIPEPETQETIREPETQETIREADTGISADKGEIKAGTNLENSIKLFDSIAADENFMMSPLSLNYALGMLSRGADGNTKAQIDAYLATDDFGKTVSAYKERIEALNKEVRSEWSGDYDMVFEIANSLWVNDRRCTLKEKFAKNLSKEYDAVIENPDFSDAVGVARQVNSWCNKKTRGLIPEVVSAESIKEDTAAILANAVYFESPWMESWNTNEEQEEFKLLDGSKSQISYLNAEGGSYFENDKATAFAYPYMDGLEFIGILPKKEGSFTLGDLDIPELISNRSKEFDELYLKMPRINFSTDIGLKAALQGIGVTDMFTEKADFSKLSSNPLFVEEAIQKTRIELDEKGTKAAAVTVINTTESFAPPEKEPVIKRVELTRPYAFAIYDPETEEVVFLGKVTDPAAK